ncbi:hypothetical protein [Moraxella lacunata]|uniref:hypothetical protein n=1 Tax=Moraxella lacunata TaxID=477 RepID=UPI003EE1EC54
MPSPPKSHQKQKGFDKFKCSTQNHQSLFYCTLCNITSNPILTCPNHSHHFPHLSYLSWLIIYLVFTLCVVFLCHQCHVLDRV